MLEEDYKSAPAKIFALQELFFVFFDKNRYVR
jgi:hypothetical protein